MNISTAIQFTESYIQSKDRSGLLDPFNYCGIMCDYWLSEPSEQHVAFLKMIKAIFGTTAFIKVSQQLSQHLLDESVIRLARLIELSAPEIIIDNFKKYISKLQTNDIDPHLLISMLVISKAKLQFA